MKRRNFVGLLAIAPFLHKIFKHKPQSFYSDGIDFESGSATATYSPLVVEPVASKPENKLGEYFYVPILMDIKDHTKCTCFYWIGKDVCLTGHHHFCPTLSNEYHLHSTDYDSWEAACALDNRPMPTNVELLKSGYIVLRYRKIVKAMPGLTITCPKCGARSMGEYKQDRDQTNFIAERKDDSGKIHYEKHGRIYMKHSCGEVLGHLWYHNSCSKEEYLAHRIDVIKTRYGKLKWHETT